MSRYIDADKLEPDTEWDEREDGFISYSQLNIDQQPTADVRENVKGTWKIYCDEKGVVEDCYCDQCGSNSVIGGNYCPNCGADMRGEE